MEKKNVLVIGSDSSFRIRTASLLKEQGHKVTTACNELAGIETIHGSQSFDFVIVEESSRNVDALKVLRVMRKTLPNARGIILTDEPTNADFAFDALELRAVGTFHKMDDRLAFVSSGLLPTHMLPKRETAQSQIRIEATLALAT